MRNLVASVVLLVASAESAVASENVVRSNFDGTRHSDWAAVAGEKQELSIALDETSVFEGNFDNTSRKSRAQRLASDDFEVHGDVLHITFTSHDGSYGYKLVLSGWKSATHEVLYGSMFMYRAGVQFNMLPVSFRQADDTL